MYTVSEKNAQNFGHAKNPVTSILHQLNASTLAAAHGRNLTYLIYILLFICIFKCFATNAQADDVLNTPLSIRVGAYENKPKVYLNDSGEVVGLFPDILRCIAQKERWRINWIPGTWSQCLKRLETGEIDLMPDVAYSEARAQKYDFTRETMLVNWAVIYTNTTQTIESLIDLNEKRIAVMKGSIHTDGADGIKNMVKKFDITCRFSAVDSYKAVFDLVSRGDADAGVVNRLFGSLFSEIYNVRKTTIIFNPRHLRFACPKDSAMGPVLIDKLDQHLDNLKKEPESIYNKALSVYLSGLPRELIFTEFKKAPGDKKVPLTPAEKAWISAHPIIRLGIDPEFAPFEYVSSKGEYEGIASDYIQLLNERLGLNMQVAHQASWKEAVEKARNKEIDVLPCVGVTRERTQFILFSKPYIHFYRVIISRTNKPFLTGLRDIEGMKVAVQANSSHEGYLKDNTDITPVPYNTLQETLLAVSKGDADVLVGNLTSSTFWIRKLNLTNLKVAASVSQETQKLHFAVRDDWPELVQILNKGLDSVSREELNQIHKRWVNIEYQPGISSRDFWRNTIRIAGVIAVIFLIIMFWNYKLSKEIRKRIEIENKLHKANESLKALDQLKSMFIASMSHELRTPLNSIIGFTGVILQEMSGPLNDKQKDHLSRVYSSAKHLLSLITDVIDISKIEAGRIDIFPQEFFIWELMDEALITIQPQLNRKQLKLETSIPKDFVLVTDRKRLLQCVINYLSNAVKYTETGTIRVKAEQMDDHVKIEVSDTGVGISEHDQVKLFEAFERFESRLKVKSGGTGLGLYLTRKLAKEILGGDVQVTSRKGEGSTFGLVIPIRLNGIESPQNAD